MRRLLVLFALLYGCGGGGSASSPTVDDGFKARAVGMVASMQTLFAYEDDWMHSFWIEFQGVPTNGPLSGVPPMTGWGGGTGRILPGEPYYNPVLELWTFPTLDERGLFEREEFFVDGAKTQPAGFYVLNDEDEGYRFEITAGPYAGHRGNYHIVSRGDFEAGRYRDETRYVAETPDGWRFEGHAADVSGTYRAEDLATGPDGKIQRINVKYGKDGNGKLTYASEMGDRLELRISDGGFRAVGTVWIGSDAARLTFDDSFRLRFADGTIRTLDADDLQNRANSALSRHRVLSRPLHLGR